MLPYGEKQEMLVSPGLIAGASLIAGMHRATKYTLECYDSEGNLKWRDEFSNLVTTVGLNDSLDKHFKASAYTSAWYVGLTSGSTGYSAADTMSSHAGWTENTTYSGSTRPTLTLGTVAAGSVDNSASKANYSINGTTTIGGAFLVTEPTSGSTSGILYGVGAFSGGSRSVISGDTLAVTVTLTAS